MAATLFVVATPIGNLEDITLRALRVLRDVDVVAAEDTRRTGNLLRHFEITTPLLSLHQHNETDRVPQVLSRLRSGKSVALVSDAGTPGISDPGATLVRAVRAEGIAIVPIPGASAVTTALSVSGISETPFTFLGFVPIRLKARISWLMDAAARRGETVIFFEAPHRILKTLGDMRSVLVERPIILGRELTKVHEEWLIGSAAELLGRITQPQGEFVVIIPPALAAEEAETPIDDDAVMIMFGQITESEPIGRKEAVRAVAKRTNLSVKAVYAAIERAKNSVN